MNKLKLKKVRFERRKKRIKKKIFANKDLYRLCIHRSNKNFYAQIIDDKEGKTLMGLSTLSKEFSGLKNSGNIAAAKELGKKVAEQAIVNGIKKVVFDRNGFLYHGKIKAFVDSVRENGLEI